MKFNFKETERSGNETIKAEGLSKSFQDKVIFKDAALLINFGERAALVGPNGSGKTTFLKILLGEEPPDAGIPSARPRSGSLCDPLATSSYG